MAVKHGNLSINSENIFPIIKKWLYSDHDIFVRELVSNGCDAITKLKKLEVMGEYTFPEGYKPEIQVIVNPDEKTLKFIDNGIGMTADEVEKYITQIAFSGATQFLEKYKDKTTDDQMIGHFGLGFYSAFMVADEVHIDTLSYTEGALLQLFVLITFQLYGTQRTSPFPGLSLSIPAPTAAFGITKAGTYTLTVTFDRQKYNGSEWENTGEQDTKQVNFSITQAQTVTATPTPQPNGASAKTAVKTGDTTNITPFVIILAIAAGCIVGVVVYKRRKK